MTDKRSGVEYAPHRRDAAGSRVGRAVRRARERSAIHGYRAAAAAIPHAVLIEYDGAPHGLFATHKDRLTADLLAFLRS